MKPTKTVEDLRPSILKNFALDIRKRKIPV